MDFSDESNYEPEQIKRRLNSEKIDPAAVELDEKGRCALIQGSEAEPYRVTLDSCTCYDFLVHGQPCKHMYRLAADLGELPPLPAKSRSAVRDAQADAAADIECWKKAFMAGGISAAKYIKIVNALNSK
jgi:hypothetical protein